MVLAELVGWFEFEDSVFLGVVCGSEYYRLEEEDCCDVFFVSSESGFDLWCDWNCIFDGRHDGDWMGMNREVLLLQPVRGDDVY